MKQWRLICDTLRQNVACTSEAQISCRADTTMVIQGGKGYNLKGERGGGADKKTETAQKEGGKIYILIHIMYIWVNKGVWWGGRRCLEQGENDSISLRHSSFPSRTYQLYFDYEPKVDTESNTTKQAQGRLWGGKRETYVRDERSIGSTSNNYSLTLWHMYEPPRFTLSSLEWRDLGPFLMHCSNKVQGIPCEELEEEGKPK